MSDKSAGGTILFDNLYLAIAFADNLQNHLQTVCFAVAANEMAVPLRPARPVLPILWI